MNRTKRITVVGCGHVGAVTAACLAHLGHDIRGLDVDRKLIEALETGSSPFFEPGLSQLLTEETAAGRLSFGTSYPEALADCDYVFLCVNTPARWHGAVDLSFVRGAVTEIASTLASASRLPLIITKSTSPIGTCESIQSTFDRCFRGVRRTHVVANPEFLREGSAVQDFLNPDRVVIGADYESDGRDVASLYGSLRAPLVMTDVRTAEMIKYAANAFLATRLSFVNELAGLCEAVGVDVDAVLEGASRDPRIGSGYLRPGIGYGGSCLPKDVAALCHTGHCVGRPMQLLASVQAVNLAQHTHAVNGIRQALDGLDGRTIGVWGATFKGGSEDLRASPALDVIALLRNEGARVQLYDPALPYEDARLLADSACLSAIEAVSAANCLAILTDWTEFAEVDLREVRRAMAGRFIYDGRNLLSRAVAEASGFTYQGVGRPARSSARATRQEEPDRAPERFGW